MSADTLIPLKVLSITGDVISVWRHSSAKNDGAQLQTASINNDDMGIVTRTNRNNIRHFIGPIQSAVFQALQRWRQL